MLWKFTILVIEQMRGRFLKMIQVHLPYCKKNCLAILQKWPFLGWLKRDLLERLLATSNWGNQKVTGRERLLFLFGNLLNSISKKPGQIWVTTPKKGPWAKKQDPITINDWVPWDFVFRERSMSKRYILAVGWKISFDILFFGPFS